MAKKLMKGSEVYMSSSSGCVGYGNIQCVSSVCEPLGEISLYGHNQAYKTYDVKEIVSSPEENSAQEKQIEAINFLEWVVNQDNEWISAADQYQLFLQSLNK